MDQITDEHFFNIRSLGLRIQLSATAVATSFVLIFVPNVETLTFTAFLLGYMFPVGFALSTIITIAITWEVMASIVFAFSGFIFPFKLLAWIIIGLLGNFARKINAKYFYEFLIFGGVSGIIYDLLTTIPSAFIFIGDETSFLTVLLSNLVLGVFFTISHSVSNAILFSFKPFIYHSIIPLLTEHYNYLCMATSDTFSYFENSAEFAIFSLGAIKTDKKRLLGYIVIFVLMISALTGGIYFYSNQTNPAESDTVQSVQMSFIIDYDGILDKETHKISAYTNESVLDILQSIAVVNYTHISGRPYIQAINNVWEDQNRTNHYWVYYVNDVFSNLGAADNYVQQNDNVTWVYQ